MRRSNTTQVLFIPIPTRALRKEPGDGMVSQLCKSRTHLYYIAKPKVDRDHAVQQHVHFSELYNFRAAGLAGCPLAPGNTELQLLERTHLAPPLPFLPLLIDRLAQMAVLAG
mmetsp:Transcript_26187/g.35729  ORF Transcript_26187/g.35729 Transcript_26187/m.35729 type:complete len:112 (-) Transcript_26187:125-460(-)